MYKCPHCSASCDLKMRWPNGPRDDTWRCGSCDGEVRESDWLSVLELVGLTVIPAGLILLLFVLPFWASAVLWVVTPVSLVLLGKKYFPPVAAEPYGSARDVKRSAIRFWLIAPPVLILTCLVIWEIFTGD
jgi:hypothetical protein